MTSTREFTTTREILDRRTHKFAIGADNRILSYADVLGLWQTDERLRFCFIELLAAAGFDAYCWETPPITSRTVERPFEFVLIDAPYLSTPPDPHTFASHFARDRDGTSVVVFDNLGGDATLIAPCPVNGETDYSHFGSFIRTAPDEQRHALLNTMGKTVQSNLGQQPLWLSTAGGGVAWLHVRLDSRPKYYAYGPYRRHQQPG